MMMIIKKKRQGDNQRKISVPSCGSENCDFHQIHHVLCLYLMSRCWFYRLSPFIYLFIYLHPLCLSIFCACKILNKNKERALISDISWYFNHMLHDSKSVDEMNSRTEIIWITIYLLLDFVSCLFLIPFLFYAKCEYLYKMWICCCLPLFYSHFFIFLFFVVLVFKMNILQWQWLRREINFNSKQQQHQRYWILAREY